MVNLTDLAGNQNNMLNIGNITVDNLNPAITITSPSENEVTNDNTTLITFTVNGTGSGIDLSSLTAVVNATVYNSSNMSTPDNVTFNLTTVELPDGSHTLEINVSDMAGNSNSSGRNFTIDTINPIVKIHSPESRAYNNESLSLNYTIINGDIDSCWYSVDGGADKILKNCTNTTFNVSSEGGHNITLCVNDTAGNVGSSIVFFTVDKTPPEISNASVSRSTVLLNDKIEISADVTDNLNLSAAWAVVTKPDSGNETVLLNSAGNFTNTSLTGIYDVTIYANDTAGNINSTGLSFTVVVCIADSDCGADGYTGDNYCSGGDLYNTYRTYTCSNPGTVSAFCSHSDKERMVEDCGESLCAYGKTYCSDNNVVRNVTCFTQGCKPDLRACFTDILEYVETLKICGDGYICSGGECILAVIPEVVINEIMYQPIQNESYNEWIELYNPGDSNISLEGWEICDDEILGGYVHHEYGEIYLNTGLEIPAEGYAVVTNGITGTEVYSNFNVRSGAVAFHVNSDRICGGLDNTGMNVTLKNSSGALMDSVTYNNSLGGNGNGHTLERIDLHGNWAESGLLGGTPGFENIPAVTSTSTTTTTLIPTTTTTTIIPTTSTTSTTIEIPTTTTTTIEIPTTSTTTTSTTTTTLPGTRIQIRRNITANETTTLEVPEFGIELDIRTLKDVEAIITLTLYSENPTGANFSLHGFRRYIRIEPNSELEDHLEFVVMRLFYSDEEIIAERLDERSLSIYRYNSTANEWSELNSSVSTVENYIRTNMTHFSAYTAGGELDTKPPELFNASPTGSITDNKPTLRVTTDEPATCRYDTTDREYKELEEEFHTTGNRTHRQTLELPEGSYTFYIRCSDIFGNANEISTVIEFSIVASPSYEGFTILPAREGYIISSCHDGVKNYGETGIDCGGKFCKPCPTTTTSLVTTTTVKATTTTTTTVTTTTSSTTTTIQPSVGIIAHVIKSVPRVNSKLIIATLLLVILIVLSVYRRSRTAKFPSSKLPHSG